MQYIDSCCKNNERTYRVENKKPCHNVQSVNRKNSRVVNTGWRVDKEKSYPIF